MRCVRTRLCKDDPWNDGAGAGKGKGAGEGEAGEGA